MIVPDLVSDERPIASVMIQQPEGGYLVFERGVQNVTDIRAYGEPGPHCFIAWIAIFMNHDRLPEFRIPADAVTIIHYEQALKMGGPN